MGDIVSDEQRLRIACDAYLDMILRDGDSLDVSNMPAGAQCEVTAFGDVILRNASGLMLEWYDADEIEHHDALSAQARAERRDLAVARAANHHAERVEDAAIDYVESRRAAGAVDDAIVSDETAIAEAWRRSACGTLLEFREAILDRVSSTRSGTVN